MLMEVSYRDVPKTDELDKLIRTKAEKLRKFCEDIVSCRVAVERRQQRQKLGNPHRVRIEVTLPPNKNLVVSRDPGEAAPHEPLSTTVRDAFKAMERQVKEANSMRRGEVKTHDEPVALVARLFTGEGYGFLITNDGREIYFHRNAVVQGGTFDDLAVGTEVRFAETMGDDGPQASTVKIANAWGLRDAAESVETGAPTGRASRTRGRPSTTRR